MTNAKKRQYYSLSIFGEITSYSITVEPNRDRDTILLSTRGVRRHLSNAASYPNCTGSYSVRSKIHISSVSIYIPHVLNTL